MLGQKFGAWTVVKQLSNGNGKPCKQYICKCACGKLQQKYHHELIKRKSSACHNCCKKEEHKSFYKTKEEKTERLLKMFGGSMNETRYKIEDLDYCVDNIHLYEAITMARNLMKDVNNDGQALWAAARHHGVEMSLLASHVSKIGHLERKQKALMNSENTPKLLSLDDRYKLFLQDIEELNDPFLVSVFKNYKAINVALTLKLPADFKFFEDLLKSTECRWKPVYEKHFNNVLFTVIYDGKDQ